MLDERLSVCCNGKAPIVNRAHGANKNVHDPDLNSYRLLYRDKPEFGSRWGQGSRWGRASTVRPFPAPSAGRSKVASSNVTGGSAS